MSDNRARYPIAVMCRILGVSLSGYYAWVKRPACARALMDTALTAEIRAAHAASKGTYGAPRLQIDLAEAGIQHASPSSSSSRASTIRVGVTHRSGIFHPLRSSVIMKRPLSSPVHTSMPSCSRLSRSGLQA